MKPPPETKRRALRTRKVPLKPLSSNLAVLSASLHLDNHFIISVIIHLSDFGLHMN